MLRVDDVRMSMGGTAVLKGVTFDVPAGVIVGLVGPNGAGKSSTLRLAAGLASPDSGEIVVLPAGQPPASSAAVAYAGQQNALYPALTVEENLLFFSRVGGRPRSSERQSIADALDDFELAELRQRRVGRLSGGQQRRTHLAGATLLERPILLLDEPTVGLDASTRDGFLNLLRRRRAAGVAVCYASHHTSELEAIADRIVVMRDGRVLADDTLSALVAVHAGTVLEMQTADGEELRRELPAGADPSALLQQTEGLGRRVTSYRVLLPGLETAVFSLIRQATTGVPQNTSHGARQ